MIMELNLGMDIACALVLAALLVSAKVDEKQTQSTRLFMLLGLTGFLVIAVSVLQTVLLNDEVDPLTLDILIFLEITVLFFCYFVFSMYYFSVKNGSCSLSERRFVALLAGGIAMLIAFAVLLDMGMIVNVESDGEATWEPGSILIYLLFACPLLVVFADGLISARNAVLPSDRKEALIFSLTAILPILIGFILVLHFPDIPFECAGTVLCLLFLTIFRTNCAITKDANSGFGLRYLMMPYLEKVFEKNRGGTGTVIAVTDMDRYKYIVDNFGHGDSVKPLIMAADAIKTAIEGVRCRAFSSVGSSDEMFLIMDKGTAEDMEEVRRKICEILAEKSKELPYELHASIGIAVQTPEMETPEELFEKADKDMYAIKEAYYALKGYKRRK